MNGIQIFPSEEFGSIRMIVIKGTEYFFGVDIATALQYKRARKAITDNCKGVLVQDTIKNDGGYPEPLIPLGDVYRLIVKASTQSNSEDIKEKAGRFERIVFDEILPQIHKTGSYGTPKTLEQQVQVIAQGTTELYQRMNTAETRITDLEETMTLDYGQQRFLENTVNKTVTLALGGKESNAYRKIARKVFAECNGDLKDYFKVNARANIPRKRYEESVSYAENWKPCTNTIMLIEQFNAQRSLFEKGGIT